VIVAHLGSGASMCALADGRSVESTMGFTASTDCRWHEARTARSGVVLYLLTEKGMSANAVQSMLYSECGLKDCLESATMFAIFWTAASLAPLLRWTTSSIACPLTLEC